MSMFQTTALCLALGGLVSVSALALEEVPAVPRSLVAPRGTYDHDTTHAIVEWGVSHMGLSLYRGRFNTVSGQLEFNSAEPEKSSLSVTIAAASVDTPSDKLNVEIPGPDVFDSAKYPDITFKSTSITKTGEATGTVTGDLTFRGITKPVTLDVVFNGAGMHPMRNTNAMGFAATGTLKRSDFGVVNWAPAVGDTVTLRLDVEFLQVQP